LLVRAIGRASAVAVVLALAATVAGCGQPSASGPVIGVRPATSPNSEYFELDPASIADSLHNQLSLANDTNPITGENKLAKGELPIDSLLTLKQSERLSALQQLGNTIIQDRLTAIAALRSQVLTLPPSPGGHKETVKLLDSATAALHAMQVKIARDQLVDQARADVTAVAALRVYGLLLPQVHMLITAYDLERLAGIYTSQQAALQQDIDNAAAAGAANAPAQQAVDDLAAQITIMNRVSRSAMQVLPGLTASGYPGNRQQLADISANLKAARSASDQAANDILQAKIDLGV
jgi:hypothetical protein